MRELYLVAGVYSTVLVYIECVGRITNPHMIRNIRNTSNSHRVGPFPGRIKAHARDLAK